MRREILVRAAGLVALSFIFLAVRTSAADSPTIDTCNEKSLLPAQIQCFLDAAKAADDVGVCESASDPVVRFHCLSLYAEQSLDPAPCHRIEMGDQDTQALRDACITGVAIARREPALCATPELVALRDSCYMMLVVEQGADPLYCQHIENAVLKEVCLDESAGSGQGTK